MTGGDRAATAGGGGASAVAGGGGASAVGGAIDILELLCLVAIDILELLCFVVINCYLSYTSMFCEEQRNIRISVATHGIQLVYLVQRNISFL
jgi:hypothetical protein